uniref:T4 RNA ligase 1-like N-terminal domain-containing protein n=1 Tax=viral metagenome TaxID=1070528 RepID=A0A6C0EQP6_9ZZZZ
MADTLEDIIKMVYDKCENGNYPNTLINILKQKHYWPVIKVKKFKNNNNLCLLHNSYKRDDVSEFQDLYDKCRSVVLDFSKSIGNNVVISISNSIPIRSNISNYTTNIYEENDICYSALDGTVVTVYYHNGIWYFGSSSCPDINSSKFSNKDKTHGYMLDEILYDMYKNHVNISDPNISTILRNLFTSNLSPLYSYDFVIIHSDNIHVINYTNMMGDNYRHLFHINTKNRISLIEENIDNHPLAYLGVKYPIKFTSPQEGIAYISTNNNNNYGIIIKKNNKLYKISDDAILHKEEVNAFNYNKWYNILYIYMLQKPNYNINEFINEFYQGDLEIPNDTYNTIDLIFNIIKQIIYNLYVSTTNYYPKYNRFKVDLNMDKTLNPLIRFHLAQLRHQQTTIYKKKIINEDNVFNYLCHSNNIKNIQKLINHFAKNHAYNLTPDIIVVLTTLSNLLENNPSIQETK